MRRLSLVWRYVAATLLPARVFFFMILLALPALAREQVVIQKSGTNAQLRAADTWLDQLNPTATAGSSATLIVRNTSPRRALVVFDLSLLPNVGIKTATLTLNVVTPPSANRTYTANLITSFWDGPNASWNNRTAPTAWGAPGGNFDGTVSASTTVTTGGTSASWTVTTALRVWYNSSANYGFLVKDNTENDATGRTTTFSSMEDTTPANRPSLTVTFLQNVVNFKATPGNGSNTLTWAYPTPVAGGTILEPYAGVVILRRATAPVDKNSFPTNGNPPPAVCSTVGTSTVVFVGTMADTSFPDTACGGVTNGAIYYYKAFTYDTANNYATNPTGLPAPREGGSTFSPETGAMPNVPGLTQAPLWMIGTHSSNLAPPAIMPTAQVDIGTDTNLLFAVDATTGERLYAPVALGGIITGRPPILDATDASIAKQVAYVACRDNYVYAVDTLTGQLLWLVEPNNSTTNLFQGGAAVQMKKFSNGGFTLANDLVVVGTRNGGSITTNRIIGLDGNTGSAVWTYTGGAGATTALDIISSTPMVDYLHNAVWVTSRANNGAAQPNLWKLDSVDGTVLFQMNAGSSNIDSSPSLTQNGDVLFVGTNGSSAAGTNGRLYAINPLASTSPPVSPAVQGATVAFYDDGNDGPVRGFPFIVNTSPPYIVVYTTNTMVHAVSFDPATNAFTQLWTTTIFAAPTTNTLSAPVVSTVFGFVYAGGSDGYLYELNLATGAIVNRAVVDIFYPAIVGDPALDEVNQRVYVSTVTNDQRAYGITIPY